MRAKDLRELTKEELHAKEMEFGQELFNLRFQKAAGQLGNTAMILKTRRNLARVKTVVRALEITGAVE